MADINISLSDSVTRQPVTSEVILGGISQGTFTGLYVLSNAAPGVYTFNFIAPGYTNPSTFTYTMPNPAAGFHTEILFVVNSNPPSPGALVVTVKNLAGDLLSGIPVTVVGPNSFSGTTDGSGIVSWEAIPAGDYTIKPNGLPTYSAAVTQAITIKAGITSTLTIAIGAPGTTLTVHCRNIITDEDIVDATITLHDTLHVTADVLSKTGSKGSVVFTINTASTYLLSFYKSGWMHPVIEQELLDRQQNVIISSTDVSTPILRGAGFGLKPDGASFQPPPPGFDVIPYRAPTADDWVDLIKKFDKLKEDFYSNQEIPLVLVNSWQNTTDGVAVYRAKNNGDVFISAFILKGVAIDGTILFTLPAKARPTKQLSFSVLPYPNTDVTNNSIKITIDTNGNVKVYNMGTAIGVIIIVQYYTTPTP